MDTERMNPNLENFRRLDALDIYFKAIRCYYICCMYFSVSKHKEVVSLLKFCEEMLISGTKKIEEIKNFENYDELI